MSEITLDDVLVVKRPVVLQRGCHFLSIGKIRGVHQLSNTPVKMLYHAIGLGMFGRDQAVLNVQPCTDLVKRMVARGLTIRREAVGEFLTVIGQNDFDVHRTLLMQAADKSCSGFRAFVMDHF